MPRIVSLLPAGTEIAAALGLIDEVVGVSHECDFPPIARERPRLTHCRVQSSGLTSSQVDEWVRRTKHENGTIYRIDEPLLRELRPDVILTQQLCDVCAVGHGTVARLAATLPGPPQVVNLEPSSLSDIFEDIRRVAVACGVCAVGEDLVTRLLSRIEAVRRRVAHIADRPRCFLMEWVDPPFCSGHWGPELVEIAGGYDPIARKGRPSKEIQWQDVLDARPEIIVLALCGYGLELARRDYELLRQFPEFRSIPAVGNRQIYLADANAFFARPGPRIVDSLELLAGIMHPNEFPDFRLAEGCDGRAIRAG
jgi:iron complex transport system substrate-binding protein